MPGAGKLVGRAVAGKTEAGDVHISPLLAGFNKLCPYYVRASASWGLSQVLPGIITLRMFYLDLRVCTVNLDLVVTLFHMCR